MAKKKGASASPFVPVDEQPYPIPENWCWVKFSKIIELISGRDAALADCNSEGLGIPYILGASNIENDTFTIERWIEAPQVISKKGDILLSVKGTIGKLYIQQEEKVNISRQIMAIRPTQILKNKLAYLFLQSVSDELRAAGNGLIPGISRVDILDKIFPFMPLPEQQRIVDRIESLFAKLDEAKEKAQAVVDGFELRKSAILHKAFTGELTEKWRKEHGVGLDSWVYSPWGNLIMSIEAGKNWSAEGRPPEDSEFGVVKVSAVTWGEFNELESKTCTLNEQWNEKTQIHEGDFLFSRANTLQLVGNCVIVKNIGRRLMLSDKILRFSFDKSVVPEYILYFTHSDLYRRQIEQLASGNQDGMRNVSQKNIKSVEFPVPLLFEQKEIVRIIGNLYDKEQRAKSAAEAVLTQIDTMKKSILARAFRGELGTNDPAEESAAELIKSICSN